MLLKTYKTLSLVCLFILPISLASEKVEQMHNNKVETAPISFKFGNPAIILDDEEISKTEFMAYMLATYGMPIDELPTKEEAMEMASGYVLQKKYAKEALAKGLDKTDRYKEELKMYETSLLANMYMEDQRLSMDIDETMLQDLYQEMVSKIEITDEYLLSLIVVANKKDAELVLQQLKSGELTFVDAVKKYSIDEFSVKNNGILDGWFNEKTLGNDVATVLSQLKENEYSTVPIKTNAGYQIFFVHGKRTTPVVTFEEVEPQLKQQAIYKKMMEQIQKDRGNLQYTINSD